MKRERARVPRSALLTTMRHEGNLPIHFGRLNTGGGGSELPSEHGQRLRQGEPSRSLFSA